MKYLLLVLFSISTIFAFDIETPVKEFSVTGFNIRGKTDRYLELPAYNGVKVKVGLLTTEVEVDELKTYTLRSLVDGSIMGSIEEQSRQKTGLISYRQDYLLKNKNNEPVGILVVNSGWDYDFQLFSMDGANRIDCADWVLDYIDYSFGKEFSVNERFFVNPGRTTVIENIEIFNDNPDFWMAFVLTKTLLFNPGEF